MSSLDVALVQGLAEVEPDVARRVMRPETVAAHFRNGEEELWYASLLHVEEEHSPGFRLLRRIFERFPVAGVVIEGSPLSRGPLVPEESQWLLRKNELGLYENGERGFAAALAFERSIPVIGGEPTDVEIAVEMRAHGYASRDVLAMGFLVYLPQWSRLGEITRSSIESRFEREMPLIRKAHGLESAPPFAFGDLLDWYRKANGGELDPLRQDFEHLAPLVAGPLATQRMAHVGNMLRNRTVARAINESLVRHRRVLAVFGNGHLACHWKALVAAFGEPIHVGDMDERGNWRP